MTVSVQSFRAGFIEFVDSKRYPNEFIEYWLTQAALQVNAARFGKLTDQGVSLFAAHEIVIQRRAADEAANGAVPGSATGAINSQSVDKVSIGFDTGGSALPDAGHWNSTIYGQRFIKLSRQCGAGPLMIGVPGDCTPGFGPWPGPWTGLFPSMNQ